MRFSVFALSTVALAGLASAKGPPPGMGRISAQCKASIAGALASQDAACLNPTGLVAIFATSSNTSIVPAVDSWITGMCGLRPCTNQSLANVVSTAASGCQTELTNANITTERLTKAVQTVYPTVRQVACLKDNANKVYCVTQTLRNLEGVVGPLTPINIEPAIKSVESGKQSIPSSVICTDCHKAAYNIIHTNLPNALSSTTTKALGDTCGASFIDGQTPSTVSQTAISAKLRRGLTFLF